MKEQVTLITKTCCKLFADCGRIFGCMVKTETEKKNLLVPTLVGPDELCGCHRVHRQTHRQRPSVCQTQKDPWMLYVAGMTGHTEVVRVVFYPDKISFANLLKVFWESHNPTQGTALSMLLVHYPEDVGLKLRGQRSACTDRARTSLQEKNDRRGEGSPQSIRSTFTGYQTNTVPYKTRWVNKVSMYPPCISWQVGGQVGEEETEMDVS